MPVDTLARAERLLGESLEQLGDPLPTSARNRVIRVRRPEGSTVIVKHYLDHTTDGRLRERLALKSLAGQTDSVPDLIAYDDDMTIMQDLGDHPHLARAFLADDAALATTRMNSWARALGSFHATGRSVADEFEAEFRSATGTSSDYMAGELAEAADAWPDLARRIEVSVDAPFEVLAQVPERFRTPLVTLSPGDVCPDNNLDRGAELTLIDLEFATLRHVAWDVSYLVVPWPSCWCAWTVPDGEGAGAVEQWRQAFGVSVGADLDHDLALAADAWHWLSASWLLDRLLGGQYRFRPERPSPPAPDRIGRSLQLMTTSTMFPQLREAAALLLDGLGAKYDVQPLEALPAFR